MKQLVIMPGGFHPFHAGHLELYKSAQRAFPNADVKVAATNDTSNRPFPFKLKEKLAQLAGVSPGDFYQVKSPFRAEEITKSYNPADTQLIFVRSEKDATKPPQPGGVKRDGTPAYLQPIGDRMAPMTQHAYMAYLPTVEFGPGMTSATQIRTAWPDLTERQRTALVMSLYPTTQSNPQLANTVVKMLDTVMGGEAQGVAEGSKDLRAIWAADTEMLDILLNPDRKQLTDYTPEEISQLQKLAKVLGRARKISSGKFRGTSIGQVLDRLIAQSRLQQRDSGQLPNFSGRATTTADMGQQIALQTNGNYYRSQGTTWTSGRTGQRNRDANDYIKYNDKNSYNDAWTWVQSKGKQVNYRDNFNHLNTAVQIGSFIVEPNITTSNAFGDNSNTQYNLSVRTTKSLSQPSRRREDITDQQAAALQDIAQTKNNNAMDKMKMLLAMFKGEQDIKQIIDRSKKIHPSDKAKLDQIIAGAKNFTDNGQPGVAEQVTRQMSQGGMRASYQSKYNQPIAEDYLDEDRS
jgi:hypothetical protein